MKPLTVLIPAVVLTFLAALTIPRWALAKDIVRPEEIKSMRQVVYDTDTYAKLAQLWSEYYREFPSEYAYANWMYATRYARDKDYSRLLAEGVREYPANPTLLYLKALEHCGLSHDLEGRQYLERAIALDPDFADPWFVLLTHYMEEGDEEQFRLALRRLLESGVITDEVMDFNHNMLVSLEENAILITNGDNDTYPGWILTCLLNIRPDVSVVNRSLLNTEWYPLYVIERGMPRFIGKTELVELRESVLKRKKEEIAKGWGGPFGDTLIKRIVESSERAGRPVYLAKTLYVTEPLKKLTENGRDLGLVTLVTSPGTTYDQQLRAVYGKWLEDYRTGGLDSWRLRNSPQSDAGRQLVPAYASGIAANLVSLKEHAPALRIRLFNWYTAHAESLLTEDYRYGIAQAWCGLASDLQEVKAWCHRQGIESQESEQR